MEVIGCIVAVYANGSDFAAITLKFRMRLLDDILAKIIDGRRQVPFPISLRVFRLVVLNGI